MKQRCRISGEEFEVTQEELEFLQTISPVFAGKKYLIPPPDIAPSERQRRRLSFRNLRHLYRRNCDLSGKPIISCFRPESPHRVYHSDAWWSDAWDPFDYGKDFDFSRPFFEQFHEIYKEAPTISAYVILSENAEYINGAANCRNCYLCFNMDYCESCYYVTNATHAVSSIDCTGLKQCELCYECTDCERCYGLNYSERCLTCNDSYFLTECIRCQNCIACTGLVDKRYHIFNKKVSREEFERYRRELGSRDAVSKLWRAAQQHSLQYPRKHYFGHSNERFSGEGIHHIKNSYDCFDSSELENCRNCFYVFKASNCMDYDIFGDSSEWIYQCIATGLNCTHDLFSMGCWSGSSNNLYSILVNASSNCFGCCGLRNKNYCIFNKQYTKNEYEALAARIIEHMKETGEWGQFFPPELSPFSFWETVASEELPLEKEEAISRGYNWREKEEKRFEGTPSQAPNSILETDDSVCSKALACGVQATAFKIIPQELTLYRKMGIPLPLRCPEQRYFDRLARRTPRRLWDRTCDKCASPIRSAYKKERKEIVYCESCYLKEVY